MKQKIRIFILVSCAVICLFSIYQLISIQLNYKKGEKLYEDIKQQVIVTNKPADTTTQDNIKESDDKQPLLDISVDFEALKKINPDIIGWLYLPYGFH